MRLQILIDAGDLRLIQGSAQVLVADLTDDSRKASAGCAMIVRTGAGENGAQFAQDALKRGATTLIFSASEAWLPRVGVWRTSSGDQPAVALASGPVDQALAGKLAEAFFDHPARKLKLIAITGTKGKTTTAFLVQHLMRQAGWPTGMIGTVFIDNGRSRRPAELTTPGAIDFSRYLAEMVQEGCRAAVAEVSSHALHQGRVAALEWDAGVFTNLTGDHLDYHLTMDAYAEAKAILFESLASGAWAVINGQDPYAGRMVQNCRAHLVWCLLEDDSSESRDHSRPTDRGSLATAKILSGGADYSLARFQGSWGSFEARLPMVGRHNLCNALQALAVVTAVTGHHAKLRQSLEQAPSAPGRLEPVHIDHADPLPTVLVDYAHTHDALDKVLEAVRPSVKGQLVVLFGCGGDRDRTKRPKMAAVACRRADRVILTSDNPRTENPENILNEILVGVPADRKILDCRSAPCRSKGESGTTCTPALTALEFKQWLLAQAPDWQVLVQPDRAKAIQLAIELAQPDDLVLLAGKGHEDYQIIGTTKHQFDDREQAKEALRNRVGRQQAQTVGEVGS